MNYQPIKYIIGYHKIDCYAIHTLTTRKTGFQKKTIKCVTRPDLSGILLIAIIYGHLTCLIADRMSRLDSKKAYTAEHRWFEVIGTASNTSKYWGFGLTNYKHPCLPTENIWSCKTKVKRLRYTNVVWKRKCTRIVHVSYFWQYI